MRGPPPEDRIRITGSERRRLRRETQMRTNEYRFVLRRRIVLLAADGHGNTAIARLLSVTRDMVQRWRHRFFVHRLAGLDERPRAGRPPRLTSLERHEVVAMACRDPGDFGVQRTHWSISSITQAALATGRVREISETSVGTILRDADIRPYRFRMWLFSRDPLFDVKMRDIVQLYTVCSPRGEVVLSIDEKTSIQALERPAPTLRPRIGQEGRFEFEYVRHGTTCLFACFNVGTGRVLGWCNPTRTQQDFLAYLDRVADAYPRGRVHLVMDNLNTHTSEATRSWNRRHRNRFQFHFTPTHASWLNQVEIWFSILHRQCLKLGDFYSVEHLQLRIQRFIDYWNHHAHPFQWTWKGYPLRRGPALVDVHASVRHIQLHEAPPQIDGYSPPRQARSFAGDERGGRRASRLHCATAPFGGPTGAHTRLASDCLS